MSHAGLKQELLTGLSEAPARKSGRYAIEEDQTANTTAAAEPAATTSHVRQLLGINVLSPEEVTWIEARSSRPPAHSLRGPTGAVFAKPGEDTTFGALQPFYREPTLERVQLQFEDLSLDPTSNPLAHSSLRPPPRRPLSSTRVLAISVGALALASVGYLAAVASWGGPGRATTITLPTHRAKAPHVLSLDPPAEALSESSKAAATDPNGAKPPALVEDLPWSSDSTSAVPVEASAATSGPATGLVPGWNRRRLIALRARLEAARIAAAGPAAPAASETLALPAQPTRAQIKASIEGVRAALQTCAADLHGMSTAHVTIASTGRVANATIDGTFAGSPAGSCMARALRSAVFPRFSTASFQVTYPFRL